MSSDGRDDSAGDDEFVATYEPATAADIIEEAEPARTGEGEAAGEEGAVAGSFAPAVSVTPQRPAPENVLFVALGAYLSILVLVQMVPGVGIAPTTAVALTAVVAVTTLVCYGVLVWTSPDT